MKGEVLDDAALVMAEGDTVATALADLPAGRRLGRGDGDSDDSGLGDGGSGDGGSGDRDSRDEADPSVTLVEDVPFGHKVALVAHDPGDPVSKYGEVIGEATEPVARGAWVHTHNCESRRGRGDRAVGEASES